MQHYTSWFSMNFPIYGLDLCCENLEDSKNVEHQECHGFSHGFSP